MKLVSLICTRSKNFSPTLTKLTSYLSSIGCTNKIIVGADSIFSAHELLECEDNPIVILCHDDIHILTEKTYFKEQLIGKLKDDSTGLVGIAGTTALVVDAIWWNKDVWTNSGHRGFVYHGSPANPQSTYYGPPGEVLVMDGLFLATRYDTLQKVIGKPEYFEGNWDFYDLTYCIRARNLGLKNYVVPITVCHESIGELAGRDSWHKNREAFIKNTSLPQKLR